MGFIGRVATTTQFYFHGKKHFTRTGWECHSKAYPSPDFFEQNLDLSDRVYIVTGANSGVGKELVHCLASRGASVHMFCRNRQRAEACRQDIIAQTGNNRLFVIEVDAGVEQDVRRGWAEFLQNQSQPKSSPRLDGLICNAGQLLHEKTLTRDGLEVTFASHFLIGTYLLGTLALPLLRQTPNSRLVAVSSGGMLNVKWPSWEVATATSTDESYNGQLAYAYAKRGQVLLCERWAHENPGVKIVSCHPGWTATPGVEQAYGSQKRFLEPLRSLWEGTEGIAWLCVAPAEEIESGAFYLDRQPQAKHLGCCFLTRGFTHNTAEDVDEMMHLCEKWATGGGLIDSSNQVL